jgi:hypothetical protein
MYIGEPFEAEVDLSAAQPATTSATATKIDRNIMTKLLLVDN